MNAPLRTGEAVAAEAVRRLKLCTISQGAETDLGVKVYQGRKKVSDDMIPCVVLIEGPDQVERTRVGTQCSIGQSFVAFAYLRCDPMDPNVTAHQAIRDIKRAMFTDAGRPDWQWGRRVPDVEYRGREIGPRADGAAFVVAAVEFAVHFVEDVAAP